MKEAVQSVCSAERESLAKYLVEGWWKTLLTRFLNLEEALVVEKKKEEEEGLMLTQRRREETGERGEERERKDRCMDSNLRGWNTIWWRMKKRRRLNQM